MTGSTHGLSKKYKRLNAKYICQKEKKNGAPLMRIKACFSNCICFYYGQK